MRETFKCLAFAAGAAPALSIMVTPEMKDLYSTVVNSTTMVTTIVGPSGLGKSTALYWLYKQLNCLNNFFTLAIPIEEILKHEDEIRSRINDCADRSLVLLVDLVSPTMRFAEISKLTSIVFYPGKLVIAQSSSFNLSIKLAPNESSNLTEALLYAKVIQLKPFDDATTRTFLENLPITEHVDEIVEYSKGIPKLLSLLYMGTDMKSFKSKVRSVKRQEFSTVFSLMVKSPLLVNWQDELSLLVATFKLKIYDVGLKFSLVKNLAMYLSYLIELDDEESIPTQYFPGDEDSPDQLSDTIAGIWRDLNKNTIGKIDSRSVIGLYYESKLPYTISGASPFTFVVKKLRGATECRDFSLTLAATSLKGRLTSVQLPLPSTNTIWRTPSSFKSLDLLVQLDLSQCQTRLPDLPNESETPTLLAIQVSVQEENTLNKFRNSFTGVTRLLVNYRDSINIIFMMINPNWTNFDYNYSLAVEVSSGPGSPQLKDKNIYYGQPASFERLDGLYCTLQELFTA